MRSRTLSGGQVGQVCNTASTALNPYAALQGGGVCTVQNNAQGALKALETVGLLHTLAEPNLTAVSGETAKFLAGGEFPVPAGTRPAGQHLDLIQAIRRGPFLHPGRAVGRPHQPAGFHRSERTHQYRRLHPHGGTQLVPVTGGVTIPALVCAAPKPPSSFPPAAASPSPA